MTTAGTPSEDAVQLQAAMQHIDALHHTLTQSVSSFEALFADHGAAPAPDAGGAHGGTLQDALAQLHDLTTGLASELAQTLGHALEGLHQNTAQAETAAQQHAHDWDQAHAGLESALAALEQTTTQSAAAALAAFGELQTAVEHGGQTAGDLLHQFETASQTAQHVLGDTVTTGLSHAAGAFHDGIAGALTGKLTDHLTSIYQNAEQSLSNLAQTAEHVSQNFGHEAEDALQHFGHTVVEGAKNELEQAGEHLAKDALETLAATVAAAIAEGTAGAAVTGAMSPILPEVIVVKEASEAIKDLISVFKAVGSLL